MARILNIRMPEGIDQPVYVCRVGQLLRVHIFEARERLSHPIPRPIHFRYSATTSATSYTVSACSTIQRARGCVARNLVASSSVVPPTFARIEVTRATARGASSGRRNDDTPTPNISALS